MSLKIRLTIISTTIAGVIFTLASVIIYLLISAILIAQVDQKLQDTWEAVRLVMRVSSEGDLEAIREFAFESEVYFQAWGKDGELKGSSSNVNQLERPLSPDGINSAQPLFADVNIDGVAVRVLSVPLVVGERAIGTLQIGRSLKEVNRTREAMFEALVSTVLITTILTGYTGWLVIQRILRPLERAKDAAQQITQSNDLSRRIPQQGTRGDEVDQWVDAFNQNISRLEKLIETQRRFIADVGHELRTPLTVIKGNLGLMRRMKTYDEESITSISQEADRLTRLVGDLILLAQAEAGKLPMERQEVELDTVLLEVFRQLTVLAKESQTKFKLGEVDQALVCGDRDRLTQVLVNLISNGIKYTPSGGTVIVGLDKHEGFARLSIADNGPGIPAEDLPHIFERFFRAEKARQRSRDGKGYGLGLSIAYWIVVNHRGRIEVETTEGAGTTFTVWLPLKVGECLD